MLMIYRFLFFILSISSLYALRKQLSSCPAWPLTEAEMTESRGNYSRTETGIKTTSIENQGEIIVDGDQYMERLYREIELTKANETIHFSCFDADLDIMLKPNASDRTASEYTSLRNTLTRAISRGVTIRALVNLNVVNFFSTIPFCYALNKICGKVCCGPDTRHYGAIMGNLHTKLWVFLKKGETVAYNGGIDISVGRWDTEAHSDKEERKMNGEYFGHPSIHDHVLRVTGRAAIDYARHFYLRWHDPYPSFFPVLDLPSFKWIEPSIDHSAKGSLQVQVLRTVGCKGAMEGYYHNFAPRGEYSAASAFSKMVKNAKSFLYLVDQFVTHKDAMAEVAAALPHLKAVVILTNDQDNPSLLSDLRHHVQYSSLGQLLKDPEQRKKVHVFKLVREKEPNKYIYVHSKLYIADDQYLMVGSCGLERAGFTSDLEMMSGICDEEGEWVRKYRKKIWAEHLRLNESDPVLEDPLKGIEEWIRQADTGKARVRHYFPKNTEESWLETLYMSLYEPDGRCLD